MLATSSQNRLGYSADRFRCLVPCTLPFFFTYMSGRLRRLRMVWYFLLASAVRTLFKSWMLGRSPTKVVGFSSWCPLVISNKIHGGVDGNVAGKTCPWHLHVGLIVNNGIALGNIWPMDSVYLFLYTCILFTPFTPSYFSTLVYNMKKTYNCQQRFDPWQLCPETWPIKSISSAWAPCTFMTPGIPAFYSHQAFQPGSKQENSIQLSTMVSLDSHVQKPDQ